MIFHRDREGTVHCQIFYFDSIFPSNSKKIRYGFKQLIGYYRLVNQRLSIWSQLTLRQHTLQMIYISFFSYNSSLQSSYYGNNPEITYTISIRIWSLSSSSSSSSSQIDKKRENPRIFPFIFQFQWCTIEYCRCHHVPTNALEPPFVDRLLQGWNQLWFCIKNALSWYHSRLHTIPENPL